jgi:N-acetylglucosamine-6-phosphate deacetylase
VHSEGPCFGAPGAHNVDNIALPSVGLAERMLAATDGRLKAVTVAPELPGAEAFITTLKQAGVSVHFGHSRAHPEDVSRYIGWGIDAVTHMYNVMPTLPPGNMGLHVLSLTDALLAESGLALGLICDGIHVNPKLMKILAQLPADRVFLETDANKYAGSAGAEFEFYPGYWVRSAPGKAVVDREGGLCGSSLTPDEAMRNYVRLVGADLTQTAHATSLVPARILGLEHEMGSIEVGKLADFAILDPATLAVEETVVGGQSLFRRAA